jgi:Holliday junction DNA helicase RuvA
MITRIHGILESVDAGRAVLTCGPMALEVLVTTNEAARLGGSIGRPVTFHTLAHLESQSQGSSFTPRLIGFASEHDRAFFELFTTVKGIGPRKALRALARPVGEVAAAIATDDTAALIALPEIGRRTAQTIVAELAGKVDAFADPAAAGAGAGARATTAVPGAGIESSLPPAARDALLILEQLGEPGPRARALIESAIGVEPVPTDPAAIVEAAYRARDRTAGG